MAELIAYFSRADENYVGGTLKNLETGNTEIVAKLLALQTGAPLCPHAIVEKGLAIQGGKAAQSEAAIAAWTGR